MKFCYCCNFLRQGVGWLRALRGVLVSLLERREDFLWLRSLIRSADFAFPEGRLCSERHSREAQGRGFELLVDIIVGRLGYGKG